jgi:UDP-4-amino-4-deoxy-L-arabinose formyltransferase/UDP-glucuronic acid dehydrogenase (UDP-4-keto-hexauronic acid decarboxylating)
MGAKVLFMGYGKVGCHCLQETLRSGMEVVGIVCRESDRGGTPGSLRALASSLGLFCPEIGNPNSPGFIELMARRAPDYIFSVQYDRILKPRLISLPRRGCLNLHFAPLPRLRGCFPTKWAIINNEPSGVTLHRIDAGIDSGDILDQRKVPLQEDETDQSLYGKVERAGMELFSKHVDGLARFSLPTPVPQDGGKASYHPRRLPFDGMIDWERDAGWIERFVRAFTFPPYPAAKAFLGRWTVEIPAPVRCASSLARPPGCFQPHGEESIQIACGMGSLFVDQVILEGERIPAGRLVARDSTPTLLEMSSS